MTIVLDWCPIGDRNADDAPMAAAIRNGSGEAPRVSATPVPMGAMRITAAALLITADSSNVVTSTTPIIAHGGRKPPRSVMMVAILAAPPVVSSAAPTGIMAPSSMMTGQSIAW